MRKIEYYDLETGTRGTLIDLKSRAGLNGIYAIYGGLALLWNQDENAAFELRLYSSDGNLIETQELELLSIWEENGTMLTMNPVINEGGPNYGYYAENAEGGLTPAVLHIGSGSTLPIEGEWIYPALLSHAAPDTSLRLAYTDPYSDRPWTVTDSKGNVQLEMRLEGAFYKTDIALSPDGKRVAFLPFDDTRNSDPTVPAPLMVVDETGVHELDFTATQIQWGAIDYIFSHVEPAG